MLAQFQKQISQTLEEIQGQGLFKTERVITSPQEAHISITGGKRVSTCVRTITLAWPIILR